MTLLILFFAVFLTLGEPLSFKTDLHRLVGTLSVRRVRDLFSAIDLNERNVRVVAQILATTPKCFQRSYNSIVEPPERLARLASFFSHRELHTTIFEPGKFCYNPSLVELLADSLPTYSGPSATSLFVPEMIHHQSARLAVLEHLVSPNSPGRIQSITWIDSLSSTWLNAHPRIVKFLEDIWYIMSPSQFSRYFPPSSVIRLIDLYSASPHRHFLIALKVANALRAAGIITHAILEELLQKTSPQQSNLIQLYLGYQRTTDALLSPSNWFSPLWEELVLATQHSADNPHLRAVTYALMCEFIELNAARAPFYKILAALRTFVEATDFTLWIPAKSKSMLDALVPLLGDSLPPAHKLFLQSFKGPHHLLPTIFQSSIARVRLWKRKVFKLAASSDRVVILKSKTCSLEKCSLKAMVGPLEKIWRLSVRLKGLVCNLVLLIEDRHGRQPIRLFDLLSLFVSKLAPKVKLGSSGSHQSAFKIFIGMLPYFIALHVRVPRFMLPERAGNMFIPGGMDTHEPIPTLSYTARDQLVLVQRALQEPAHKLGWDLIYNRLVQKKTPIKCTAD